MPTEASALTAAANTPAYKARRLLESYHTLGYDDQEKLITLFSNAVSPDDNETTQDSAWNDAILAQLSDQLENENFSHDTRKDKLTPAGRKYINDRQLILDPPPPTNSMHLIEELYTKDRNRWKFMNDQDCEPLTAPSGTNSIRVFRSMYNPTYNYGDGSGFYSIKLPNGDGSFLVIIGISKRKSQGLHLGVNGRIKDTHTKHAGRGYVTVIRGIPVDTLERFELMIKKMAFPLRPDDHVGTELFQAHTEKDADGFTGMIVNFAVTLVVEEKTLVIPADINHPETDFISIKKPSQEEEGITYVEEHPKTYQARQCNHNHWKFEEKRKQADILKSKTDTQMFDYIYNKYTQHGKRLPSNNANHEHTEIVILARFLDNMREKLLSGAANEDEERGCAMIKLYASREDALAARVAAYNAQISEEWTEEKLTEHSASLTKFQKKLGRIGVGKRPVIPKGNKLSPFTKEEQLLGRQIHADVERLRSQRLRKSTTIDDGLKARIEIYIKHDLVEFMPDWDGESSSSFTVAEMRAWNDVRRIVVKEPVVKISKKRAKVGKRRTPSSDGLLANNDRRSTRAPRATPNLAPSRTRRKRKASTLEEEEQQQTEDEIVEERIVPGIINAGNTCYAASLLQLLFSSKQLVIDLFGTYNAQSLLGKELPLTEAVLNVAKDIGLINEAGVVQSAVFTTVPVPSSVASNPNSLKVFLSDSMNDAASLLELKTIVDGIVGNFHDVSANSDDDEPEEKDTHVASQHDATEFGTTLLNLVKQELAMPKTDAEENAVAGTTSSLVDDYFRFMVREYKICETCGHKWQKDVPAHELQVQIGGTTRGIKRCLKDTFSKETNVECNCANKDKCDGKRVTKSMKLISSPRLFLLPLIRFEVVEERSDSGMTEQEAVLFNRVDQNLEPRIIRRQRKIESKVTMEESINIQPHLVGTESSDLSSRYKLRGVLHHTGTTPTSGHYITFSERVSDSTEGPGTREQWFEFDDKVGRKKSVDYVIGKEDIDMKKNCYLALYERVSDSAEGEVEDASRILGGMKAAGEVEEEE